MRFVQFLFFKHALADGMGMVLKIEFVPKQKV